MVWLSFRGRDVKKGGAAGFHPEVTNGSLWKKLEKRYTLRHYSCPDCLIFPPVAPTHSGRPKGRSAIFAASPRSSSMCLHVTLLYCHPGQVQVYTAAFEPRSLWSARGKERRCRK